MPKKDDKDSRIACSRACASKDICPGIAFLISMATAYFLSQFIDWKWIQPVTLISGTLLLVTGFYRYLNPFRYLSSKSDS